MCMEKKMAQQGIGQGEMVTNGKCKWTKFATNKLMFWEAPREVMPVQNVKQRGTHWPQGVCLTHWTWTRVKLKTERGNQRPRLLAHAAITSGARVCAWGSFDSSVAQSTAIHLVQVCVPWLLSEWCQHERMCVSEVFVLKSVGVFRSRNYIK